MFAGNIFSEGINVNEKNSQHHKTNFGGGVNLINFFSPFSLRTLNFFAMNIIKVSITCRVE